MEVPGESDIFFCRRGTFCSSDKRRTPEVCGSFRHRSGKNPLDFSWNVDSPGTGSEADYPLSFKSYAEKYFLSKTDDSTKWNRVDFKQSRKETLTGHYEENASGKGDYTKEEQKYYPIREDVDSDGSTTQKYRENISSFFIQMTQRLWHPIRFLLKK